jgi:segregation and condensation protein A
MSKLWQPQTNAYEIDTDVYSGPLDLLLDLIQKAELDITKLAIAQVTDQFLEYIRSHRDTNPDYISAFMVTAAKLIQIKSEALLPHPPVHEEEEDPGESLAQQLILYRQIKQQAHWLDERIDAHLRSYVHVPQSFPTTIKVDLSGLELHDLVEALLNIVASETTPTVSSIISIPKVTLKRKVQEIISILHETKHTSFQTLVGNNHSRLNTIVVFLAVLELVKQDLVKIEQSCIFADILISAQESLLTNQEAEFSFED